MSYEHRYKVIDELSAMTKINRQAIKEALDLDEVTLDILNNLTQEQREILARDFYTVFKLNTNQLELNQLLLNLNTHH